MTGIKCEGINIIWNMFNLRIRILSSSKFRFQYVKWYGKPSALCAPWHEHSQTSSDLIIIDARHLKDYTRIQFDWNRFLFCDCFLAFYSFKSFDCAITNAECNVIAQRTTPCRCVMFWESHFKRKNNFYYKNRQSSTKWICLSWVVWVAELWISAGVCIDSTTK